MAVSISLIVGVAAGICALNIILGLTWYTYHRKKLNEARKHQILFLPPRRPSALRGLKRFPPSGSTSISRATETGEPQQATIQTPDHQTYMDIMYSVHLAHREKVAEKSRTRALPSLFPSPSPPPNYIQLYQGLQDPKPTSTQKKKHPRTPPGLPVTSMTPAVEREMSLRSFDTASLYSVASAPHDACGEIAQVESLNAAVQSGFVAPPGGYTWPNRRQATVIREELAPDTYTKVHWKANDRGSSQRLPLSTVREQSDALRPGKNACKYSTSVPPLITDSPPVQLQNSAFIPPPPSLATPSHHRSQSGLMPQLQQSGVMQLPYSSPLSSTQQTPVRSPLRNIFDPETK